MAEKRKKPYEVTGWLANGRTFKDGTRKVQRIVYAHSGKEAIYVVCLDLQKRFCLPQKAYILDDAYARPIEETPAPKEKSKPVFKNTQKVLSFMQPLPLRP